MVPKSKEFIKLGSGFGGVYVVLASVNFCVQKTSKSFHELYMSSDKDGYWEQCAIFDGTHLPIK